MSLLRTDASKTRVRPIPNRYRRRSVKPVRIRFARPLQYQWAANMPEDEWQIYRTAIEAIRDAGIRFLLGGGFALASFTGRWRDTKDIDFYIKPADREAAIQALAQAGFKDYYSQLAYDRKWIYRNVRSGVIVDIIWSMANQRAQVDDQWFARAGTVTLRNQELAVIPREEFMWCKLYILQRDHCDWTDLFNLIYSAGNEMDWEHLIARLGEDLPLLQGMLTVYSWLCPREARKLPRELWRRVGLRVPQPSRKEPSYDRLRLLDSRGWFAALKQPGEKLEV